MSAADQDLRFHGDTVATPGQLDFAVNLVSGPPPGWLRRALEDGLSRMSAYPDQGPATAALAAHHGRPPGEVVILAGRRDLPGLVVIRSLTKLWGLAGIRAGYLLAPPALAGALRAARQPWAVNSLACAALAAWASQPTNHAAHQVQQLATTRERLATALATLLGVRVWPSAANFLLLQVRDGPAVRQGLAARGIAVRPCHSFPGLTANHLRVAVRDPADNQRLLDAFHEVLGC